MFTLTLVRTIALKKEKKKEKVMFRLQESKGKKTDKNKEKKIKKNEIHLNVSTGNF